MGLGKKEGGMFLRRGAIDTLMLTMPYNLIFFCPWKKLKHAYKINQHWIGNYPMHCWPRRLIYIKTNLFLYFVQNLLNYEESVYRGSLMTTYKYIYIYIYIYPYSYIHIYILNQHWISKYAMQCYPNKLIYIKVLSWELFI